MARPLSALPALTLHTRMSHMLLTPEEPPPLRRDDSLLQDRHGALVRQKI